MVLISDDGIPAARRRPGQAVFREQEASSAKTVVAQARAARPARTWPTSSRAAAAFGCAAPYTRFCRTRFSSASASASPWFPVAQSACAMLYVGMQFAPKADSLYVRLQIEKTYRALYERASREPPVTHGGSGNVCAPRARR